MSILDHDPAPSFDKDHQPEPQAQPPIAWGMPGTVQPQAPAQPERRSRKPLALITAGLAAVGATVGIAVAASGGSSSAEHKPAGTAAPVVPGNGENTGSSEQTSSAPTEASSSAAEQGPTTISNLNVAEFPAGVATHTITYNGWKMPVPDKLANPAVNPALFVQEVLEVQAIAATVPTDSPEYGQMLDLLGHPDHTDVMGTTMHTWNTKVGEMAQRGPGNIPQIVFYNEGELGASYNPASHTTTVTSIDGQSGIRYGVAAFDAADVPWQGDLVKQAAHDGTAPHSELPAYELTTTEDAEGNVVVTGMHTGS